MPDPRTAASGGSGRADRLRRSVEAVAGPVFAEGNSIDVLLNGEEIFPAMLDAIQSAERSIEFVTFVYWDGDVAQRLAEAFMERARHGVRARVILDGVGSMKMDTSLIDEMEEAGVETLRFRPPARWKFWEADHRTHRKILLCDDRVAFTGGVGIGDEWSGDGRTDGSWRDTHFRMRGPAIVGLKSAFLSDWRDADHPIGPDDLEREPPEPAGDVTIGIVDASARIGFSDAELVLEALITAAERTVDIQTPYFNPTDELVDLMVEAAGRGVEIRVLLPGPRIDKRVSLVLADARIEPLLEAGIRIWRYEPSMMHVKAVLVDGELSMIGSVNINRRSVEKDEEIIAVVLDGNLHRQLRGHFDDDVTFSKPVEAADLSRGRSIASRLLHPVRREF